MNIPQMHQLSRASQLSIVAIVILLGGVFFTVNSALQQQNEAGHANTTTYSNISIRSFSKNSNTSATQLTLSKPTGVVAGDLLMAQVVVRGATTSITPPSGWTLVLRTNTDSLLAEAVYRYNATGVDPASFTWNFNTAQDSSGGIVDLANATTVAPIDDKTGRFNANTSTVTADSVTTTTPADELLLFAGGVDNGSFSAPSGMTGQYTAATPETTAWVGAQKLTASGATGSRIAQRAIATSNIAQLIAVKPVATTIIPTATTAPQPTTAPTLAPKPTATPAPSGNLLNPSFESGTSPWYLNQTSPASGSLTTTSATAENGANSALITVTGTSTNNWDLQLNQANLTMQAGQTYTVSYWAKASSSRQIGSLIQQAVSPYTTYGSAYPTITTSWQQYSFTFTAQTTQTVAMRFNLAKATGSVWIDNVSYTAGGTQPTPTPTSVQVPAPTGLSATPGNGQVTLNWNAVSGDYYYIYVKNVTAGETSFTKLAYPDTTNTFTYTPATNGQTYQFKVSLIDPQFGEGLLSTAVSATPNASAPTPTATPLPTRVPTATPTPIGFPPITPTLTPRPTATPTPRPTATPQPTDTPVPGSTLLSVDLGLHGIGLGGDSANPGSQGNMSPLHPTRSITADIYNAQNQLVTSQQATVNFDASSGRFKGSVDLGTSFATGLYTVKIKSDQYLRGLVPGIQSITAGQTVTLPAVTLVAGDINGDNAINIVDYNLLIGCYSDLLPPTNCPAGEDVLTDITDDGHVNQFDYNLFLRELTNIGGQ